MSVSYSLFCALYRPSLISSLRPFPSSLFFFFNDTATTEIYTLSLHDALPIFNGVVNDDAVSMPACSLPARCGGDRKSTRLNSSHQIISYAVFCLKKKKYMFKL